MAAKGTMVGKTCTLKNYKHEVVGSARKESQAYRTTLEYLESLMVEGRIGNKLDLLIFMAPETSMLELNK